MLLSLLQNKEPKKQEIEDENILRHKMSLKIKGTIGRKSKKTESSHHQGDNKSSAEALETVSRWQRKCIRGIYTDNKMCGKQTYYSEIKNDFPNGNLDWGLGNYW